MAVWSCYPTCVLYTGCTHLVLVLVLVLVNLGRHARQVQQGMQARLCQDQTSAHLKGLRILLHDQSFGALAKRLLRGGVVLLVLVEHHLLAT
jgi:hypothetical protein